MPRIKNMLPAGLKEELKKTRGFLFGILYSGDNRYCPVCRNSFSRFLIQKDSGRQDAVCPRCSSLERHRMVWHFLSSRTELFNLSSRKFLHIAPEDCFIAAFRRQMKKGSYITADLYDEKADLKMDITDIQFPDESFDYIMCSHVLEHVEDDRKAMSEFLRVLKKDGIAILMVPIERDTTFEDASVKDPSERKRIFGQDDHVRIYGRDFTDRLISAGFNVQIIKAEDFCTEDEIKKMSLLRTEEIYICRK